MRLRFLSSSAFFVLLCANLAGQTSSPSAEIQAAMKHPRDLVRKAIENELKSPTARGRFTFRDTRKKAGRPEEVKQMVETSDGIVLGRLLTLDGKALDSDQRKNEDLRLQRLLDPEELAKKQKEQKEDGARVRKMVGGLPDAFNYEFSGTEAGKSGEIVVLKFRPNSDYKAPSRELRVYEGMEGTMKIAVPQNRLALMDAKLFKDVDFGWGILGRLHRGGSFQIVQTDVGNGRWDMTRLMLNFTGKVLLVKTIKIQQDETASNYQSVPPMNVSQALDMLKRVADGEIAQRN